MEVRIRTLTPIWTGDIKRESTKLRETSIMGSLRWWFEAIVRGLGGYACDGTNNKCEYKNKREDICATCELFGTTGWAKRFKVEVNQSFGEIYEGNLIISGRNKSWYYSSGLVSCDRKYNDIRKIYPLEKKTSGGEYDFQSIFEILLGFISNWGMIGGKTAIGYGVVRFDDKNGNPLKVNNKDINEFNEFFNYLEEKKNHGKNALNVPKLSEMFFVKFKIENECIDKIIGEIERNIYVKNDIKQFPNSIFGCNGTKKAVNDTEVFLQNLKDCYGFLPTSALIRKELRNRVRIKWGSNHRLRHFLMGNVQMKRNLQELDPTRFSAIQISHIYWNGENWELRIWGWIPKNISEYAKINNSKNSKISREDVVEYLKELFNSQDFWKGVFEADCIEKPDGENYIVEYPNDNWNFIDLCQVENFEKAFKDVLNGEENG